jgi:hypothetical protein
VALRNRLQEFFNGVGRDFDQDSIAIRCVEQSCPSVIEVECPLRAFLLYEVFAIFRALLTDPWVLVSAWQCWAVAAEGEHGQGDERFRGAESERDPGQQPDLGVGRFDQSLR